MKTIEIKRGLDIPISGKPEQNLIIAPSITHVAVLGDDYIGLKPTMRCAVGDKVNAGQLLFTDKKNEGVSFTAPGCGVVVEINRGEKRKFESLVIKIDGKECRSFLDPSLDFTKYTNDEVTEILVQSGLWTLFRTRPYGKIPKIGSTPKALFITAAETTPLAPSPSFIIAHYKKEFEAGLKLLQKTYDAPVHLCTSSNYPIDVAEFENIQRWDFNGPHPAGLPSTHIHMIDPANEDYVVWHISYQDVIGIGHLFKTGRLLTEKIIAIAGPGVKQPSLMKVPIGAAIEELLADQLVDDHCRILSGSVLDGRVADGYHKYLGKFHNQISVLQDDSGRSFFNWIELGSDRFSTTPVFSSALNKLRKFKMLTATWGGPRAIFPLGTYEKVMPLDIIATPLLKSITVQETEKAKALGALELIEEDVALCSFVCPGKNTFGPMLREVLTRIELEG